MRPVEWFPEMDDALREGMQKGQSLTAISKRIGVCRKTADQRRVALGIPLHGQRSNSWQDHEDAVLSKFWPTGLPASRIAEKLVGRSRNAVIGRARRLGLAERYPRPCPIGERPPC